MSNKYYHVSSVVEEVKAQIPTKTSERESCSASLFFLRNCCT